MNFSGLIIGAVFLVGCGLGHMLIVKGEYRFGTKWWPLLLVIGLSVVVISLFVNSPLLSGVLGIVGFISLWSIYELCRQKERVAKGWFPSKERREGS